ncbi:MAG TPA: PQQ-dependent sugar dehydrogenase [Gaiellaceae bacterium]|nr:PQQ-dependent sugar dehydrogenase [Gaiellaceae bacterium]
MRRGSLAAAATLVLLLVGACSGGGSEDPGSAPPPPPTEAEEPPATTEEDETETETEAEEPEAPPVRPGRPGPGGPLDIVTVATGLQAPVHAAAAPGEPGVLYVVEQAGRIRVLEGGELRRRPFLDIARGVSSGGERGLLSVAFHPDYENERRFYVNYTDRAGDTRVVEYLAAGGVPRRTRELLRVDQPYANHNGGQLAFDRNGLLYVGMGDGGSGGDPRNVAQDPASRLGKLLRLDVDEPGAEWETVGIGLRNPWRFSFDRLTGDLWLADVGQRSVEEVNFVPAAELGEGHNFGWDVYEGSREFERKALTDVGTLVEPITEYTHRFGCSVTGGFVYRGRMIRREARGRYFYGDYCSGRIWSLARWRGEVTRRGHPFRVPQLTSFAEGLVGELYAVSGEGTVYRFRKAM